MTSNAERREQLLDAARAVSCRAAEGQESRNYARSHFTRVDWPVAEQAFLAGRRRGVDVALQSKETSS